jgi:hypothetical protein
MTDTFKQDISDIIDYYNARADMFELLERAIEWFDEGHDEQRMWRCLFEHQLLKDQTKELFSAFSYDTLSTLVGAYGVKLIIVSTPDE